MEKVKSNLKIILSGISISNNFKIEYSIHKDYIKNINCRKKGSNSIEVIAEIFSDDKNKNYLIANDFKEFILRLFSLFGVSVRIVEFNIDTNSDYLEACCEVRLPLEIPEESQILNQIEKVIDSFNDSQKNGQFYNLFESNKSIDIVHRFRSLFSVFDSISPKFGKGYIDYTKLKSDYVNIIKKVYIDYYLIRFQNIMGKFTEVDLIDINTNTNYSEKLLKEINKLKDDFINDEIAFNLLKCIQIIRNKINHGDFSNLNSGIISGAYELLLPLTQALMREK